MHHDTLLPHVLAAFCVECHDHQIAARHRLHCCCETPSLINLVSKEAWRRAPSYRRAGVAGMVHHLIELNIALMLKQA